MSKTRARTVLLVTLLVTILRVRAVAQDARAVIEDASKAFGAAGLSSIAYSGSAATGNFGQSRTISFGLASTSIRNYKRALAFQR